MKCRNTVLVEESTVCRGVHESTVYRGVPLLISVADVGEPVQIGCVVGSPAHHEP
jgi:hypothetical protein